MDSPAPVCDDMAPAPVPELTPSPDIEVDMPMDMGDWPVLEYMDTGIPKLGDKPGMDDILAV